MENLYIFSGLHSIPLGCQIITISRPEGVISPEVEHSEKLIIHADNSQRPLPPHLSLSCMNMAKPMFLRLPTQNL